MLSRAGIPRYHLGSRRPHGRRLWGYNRTLCAITGASGPVYISSTGQLRGHLPPPFRTPSHQPGLSDRDKRAYSSHPRQFHHDSKIVPCFPPIVNGIVAHFQGNSIYFLQTGRQDRQKRNMLPSERNCISRAKLPHSSAVTATPCQLEA